MYRKYRQELFPNLDSTRQFVLLPFFMGPVEWSGNSILYEGRMKFEKIYIELTNQCPQSCHFCSESWRSPETLNVSGLDSIFASISGMTRVVAYHVLGDPLQAGARILGHALDLTEKYGMKGDLVTGGILVPNTDPALLLHPALKQLSFSLNSFETGPGEDSHFAALESMLLICEKKAVTRPDLFVNFRVWHPADPLADAGILRQFGLILSEAFRIDLSRITTDQNLPSFLQLAPRIRLIFRRSFRWPGQEKGEETEGFCYGLQSHFGILADGRVVPCCMDGAGVISLGNIFHTDLSKILRSDRSHRIRDGFSRGEAVEELCKKCSYKERFRPGRGPDRNRTGKSRNRDTA